MRKDYSYLLNRYLCRVGTDILNRRFHADGTVLPDHEDLENQLLEILYKRARVTSSYESQSGKSAGTITDDQAAELAASVAQFVLVAWDPAFYSNQARRGRKGGLKSRRPPKYTLADLLRVEGLTKAQAAAELGCSEGTISNLRRQQRQQDDSLKAPAENMRDPLHQ